MSPLNILFWMYWVSLYSYFLILWAFACTFCFNISVSCATSLAFATLYFLKYRVENMSFPLSEPVPVSAVIDNVFFFPVAYLSLCYYFTQIFVSSNFASFVRLINFLCLNCSCSMYQVVYICYVQFSFF